MPELKAMITKSKSQGLSALYLQVTRKTPPRGNLRIPGFGKGYVLNAVQEDDGQWRIACAFKIAPIERNIEKWEKANELNGTKR